MATAHDFVIDQGAKVEKVFQLTDKATGLPISVLGYTGRAEIRQPKNGALLWSGTTANGSVTVTDAAAGKVRLFIAATVTATFVWGGQAFFDIELTPPGETGADNRIRLVEGNVSISVGVTQG